MKNLETKQKVFDKVVNHLFKQKKCAYSDEFDTCVYLTQDGLKCAVGCLIPFHAFKDVEFSGDVRTLIVDIKDFSKKNKDHKTSKSFLKVLKRDEPMLSRLQAIHDSFAGDDEFYFFGLKNRLIDLARDHQLQWTHLKELTKNYPKNA